MWELLLGNGHVQMLRTVRAHGNEREVDVGGAHTRKLNLRFFRRLFESLHRHLVLGQINRVRLFELVYEIGNNLFVPVVATEARPVVPMLISRSRAVKF